MSPTEAAHPGAPVHCAGGGGGRRGGGRRLEIGEGGEGEGEGEIGRVKGGRRGREKWVEYRRGRCEGRGRGKENQGEEGRSGNLEKEESGRGWEEE